MKVAASAPGKLFLLGEYAVLDGSPALVAAVSARARVTITPRQDPGWTVRVRQADEQRLALEPGQPSGLPLLDVVLTNLTDADRPLPPSDLALDTAAFFEPVSGQKRGLGSSAALLTALYGALTRALDRALPADLLRQLRTLHDTFQGRSGSGGDLAASLHGGLIEYRLGPSGESLAGSVALPDSVGFACICTGQAASSPAFVGRYREWQAAQPKRAADHAAAMDRTACAGCAAAVAGDAQGLLAALAAYGQLLAELGEALGAQIVTPEHEQLNKLAERHGVTYKVSGAGGGDMGVAFAQDPARLAVFVAAARTQGFECPDLTIDPTGLAVSEPNDD